MNKRNINTAGLSHSREELYEHVDWKLALIVSQLRKMRNTYVLSDEKPLRMFYDNAKIALKPKNAKYMQTLIASQKYLEILLNIERLEIQIKNLFVDPENHKDIFQEQKKAFKTNMENTIAALKAVASVFFKNKNFMATKNLTQVEYFNKNILAISCHAKDPEDFLKLLVLQDTSKLLYKLPATRPVKHLRSCLKTAISIGVTIGIVVGAIVLGFGSEPVETITSETKTKKKPVKKRALRGTRILSHKTGVEQVNLFKKSRYK
jgi:hypothetical protein